MTYEQFVAYFDRGFAAVVITVLSLAAMVGWVWAGVETFRKRGGPAALVAFAIPFFLALVLFVGYLLTP